MLEWDILNYLKKWRTNLRATNYYSYLCGSYYKEPNHICKKDLYIYPLSSFCYVLPW